MKANQPSTTTDQLIRGVRAGDQTAFTALLAMYEPLVAGEVARYGAGLCRQDVEDLRQVALLALYRAALGFDLAQCGVEFGLYAKICISNALISQLRVIRRHLPEVSIDEQWSGEGVAAEDPARRVMEEEAAEVLHARIRSLLSPFENRVWSLYTAGYRGAEIARLLGKTPHSIENAVYRIRRKLRSSIGERG